MAFIATKEAPEEWNISQRREDALCSECEIKG
jgi:hypothetical protein